MKPSIGWKRLVALPIVALVVSACTDETIVERIVYEDRALFEEPAAEARGFLGYSDEEAKLTVCGNCHVGSQAQWEESNHAEAWAGLQNSGHAQTFCEGCHTVSELGNVVEVTAGWNAVPDDRYHDVQCESCHGSGLGHVTNPEASQPLASLAVSVDLTYGCGECHQGAHHSFVDEWSQSRHGFGGSDSYRERESCASCHEGRGALQAWGIDVDYIEKGDSQVLGITCAVCHDPHGSPNSAQLRFPIDVPNVDQNLCMKCHQRRAVPSISSSRGPHSPQGPLLLGQDVGWIPPNFAYDQDRIIGTHGSEANERLCATCHVFPREVTDALTGEFVFSSKGHLFKPIPCLDEQGIPTADEDCAESERSFASCAIGGCHGSEDAARSARLVAQTRIANLVEELNALLDLVPDDQFSTSDDVYTVAEGAKFNAGLGAIESSAIHNPFLTEALLTASIDIVKDEYGLAAMSSVSLEMQLLPSWYK